MSSRRSYRKTTQRQAILNELKRGWCHPTADEIYEKVRCYLPRISLGTVYRNLEILASQGVIRKVDVGGAQRRFDINCEQHYHIRCLQCGRVDDVILEPELMPEPCIVQSSGYDISGVHLEFSGLCPECKESGRPAR